MISRKQLRICSLLAIMGGVLNAFSDLLLRFGPVSGKEITFEYMATMPYQQTFAGAVLGGAFGTPMWLFILVPAYHALRPAGRWFSIPVVILFAHLFVVSAIYHSAFALFSAGYSALAHAGADTASLWMQMKERMASFHGFFMGLWFLLAVSGSLWFVAAVLIRETAFRKWSAALTPAMAMPASILSSFLPAPVGGYIRPMAGTLVLTLFFIMVARATWNHLESGPDSSGQT